ncbi:MAG: hypothetical protein PHQ75_10860 [Thermoguttaceae bacterium]|nr:hypothetical protein [Thermoguttaceae bacterium]
METLYKRSYYWTRLAAVLVGLFLGMGAISQGADASKQVFRAGTGIADITPTEFPTALAGGFQPIYTSEVADPLKARALVLDDGTNRFAFLVIDNCLMPTELHEKIKDLICKQTDLKRDHICVSTTHCHSAPALTGVHNAIADEKYVKTLPERAVKAVVAACGNMQAVRVGWGKAREPRYVFCRRFLMKPGTASTEPSAFTGIREDIAQMNPGHQNPNLISPTGVPDQNVYVLAFQTLDGKPFALFANYSTHYIDRGDGRVSSAYFGVFCDRIGKLLSAPPQFMAIMSNGTSGDNNSSDFINKPNKKRADMFEAADDIAHAALKAWNEIQFHDWVPLRTFESEMTLNIRKPSAADIAEANAYLAKMKEEGKTIKSRTDVYANETIIDSKLPPQRTIKIQAIRLGDIGIVAIPCEIYNFTGHDIRAYSPLEPTFIVSLANGYNGYMPTVESFELGGYTTWRTRTSILERTAEPKVRQEALDLLRKTVQ